MRQQVCDRYLAIQKLWSERSGALFLEEEENSLEKQKSFLTNEISKIDDIEIQKRLNAEFFEFGPLNILFEDLEITEILVNSPTSLWYEKAGKLQQHDDCFYSEVVLF